MTEQNDSRRYFQRADHEWIRTRFFGLMCLVMAAFLLLGIRLFYLQIIKGEWYNMLSRNNCIRMKRVKAQRGLIFDRNGRVLVENRPSFNLQLIEKDAEPLEDTIKKLCAYIEPGPEEVEQRLEEKKHGPYEPVLIQEDIDRKTVASVLAHRFKLPGVNIEVAARRHYIYPSLAPHLLGYLGELKAEEKEKEEEVYQDRKTGDYVGRYGVEKAFEQDLGGSEGGRIVQVNAGGQVVDVLSEVPPEPGNNLFLTIDFELQKTAEELLADKKGAVVAMDPDTGEVLAMASTPGFDQNMFIGGMTSEEWKSLSGDPDQPMINRAVQCEYPPASTYKIVTALAALEENVVDPGETIYCPGHYRYGNRVYHCWKKYGHGHLNIVEAIAQSCDVFFYHMGKRLGVDKIAKYAGYFGLGSPTGIMIGKEADGLIPTSDWKLEKYGVPWQKGESLSIAIGQGYNLVTPLQMAVLISAVANGGTRYRPLVMKSIETVEGKQVKKGTPEVAGSLHAGRNSLEIIRKGLLRAVNSRHGTGYWHVRSRSVDISGKTGTAQLISRRRGEEIKDDDDIEDKYKPHAWFIGYAPSENPEIAVSVFVEHGEHGSSGAGPIAAGLMLKYLGVSE